MRILVINGAEGMEDLGRLGLVVARKVAAADMIIVTSRDATGVIRRPNVDLLKIAGELDEYQVDYVDATPYVDEMVECLKQVKEAWEEAHRGRREEAIGHAAAGYFFYYFHIIVDGGPVFVHQLLSMRQMDLVQQAAREFIDGGFAGAVPEQ